MYGLRCAIILHGLKELDVWDEGASLRRDYTSFHLNLSSKKPK